MERFAEELRKVDIDWRVLLRKYLQALIPRDSDWSKRSKKSITSGYYLPATYKEKIEVAIGIDTSGSIGKEEIDTFLSEMISMAKSYREVIDMDCLTHDTEVQSSLSVKNGNIEKIKKFNIRGGGGTSHKAIFEDIANKHRKCKCAVFFTDGYSDLEEIDMKKYPFGKIIIISKGGQIPNINDKSVKIIKKKE
jgi:predicted metal-dependent peptidase